jgi:cellulose synthase operon protein YhjQ
MGSRGTEIDDQSTSDSTPEDVAVLYSWANLQGAKYRDYSASRREYRAQVRYGAAKALLERELRAQAEAEAAAEQAEREASNAETIARSQIQPASQASRIELLRSAEAAARKATDERVEAARRAEAAARATVLALREEREIAEAQASAQQQAKIYTESELRRRQLAGPQPHFSPGQKTPQPATEAIELDGAEEVVSHQGAQDPKLDFGNSPYPSLGFAQSEFLFDSETDPSPMGWPLDGHPPTQSVRADFSAEYTDAELEAASPAWLSASSLTPRAAIAPPVLTPPGVDAPGSDTLQDYREQVAARWFALRGVFEHSEPALATIPPIRPGEVRTPVLAVFSLAGGVGKTSLVATLGRVLSSQGEKVMLADTTSHGVLPFYFGAREISLGMIQTLPLPADNAGEPVSLVVYDAAGNGDPRQREWLAEEIVRNAVGNHRLLLDLSPDCAWLMCQMVNLHPTVLVPIAPDMNSVVSFTRIENLFREIADSDGRTMLPFYVLDKFDATLPLHLDVREVFRRKLGDRLLPFAIRNSPAVSEALAEGITVVDYAPGSPVLQNFLDVVSWLKRVSPSASGELRNPNWGEQ